MTLPSDLPRVLGRYELLEALGQGGMGRVILARDTVLGRKVAIKLLRGDLALAPEVREALVLRMRQEALAVAALSHPNIVTLHDMGEDATLGLYLVFEYVEGPSLRDRLRQGPLPPSQVAELARALGDALSYAHESGVIHRDVKPENVLLSMHGPKMADFGLARLPDSTLTGAGGIMGTPAYSAPETIAGTAFGPASDQFSLAATLYEALSGRRAFEGDDAVTVAGRVATQAPLPLHEVSPLGSLLGAADAALQKGLSKAPEERFASARELGATLATLLDKTFSLTSLGERASMLDWARTQLGGRARQRAHNTLAVAALVLLVGLVVLGRRSPAVSGVSLRDVAAAFASTTAKRAPPPAPSTSSAQRRAAPAAHSGGGTLNPTRGNEGPRGGLEPLTNGGAPSSGPADSGPATPSMEHVLKLLPPAPSSQLPTLPSPSPPSATPPVSPSFPAPSVSPHSSGASSAGLPGSLSSDGTHASSFDAPRP